MRLIYGTLGINKDRNLVTMILESIIHHTWNSLLYIWRSEDSAPWYILITKANEMQYFSGTDRYDEGNSRFAKFCERAL